MTQEVTPTLKQHSTIKLKMATPKLGDYQFVEPIPDKFKCWQCKELLEEPHVTECCGQHFCMKCIEKSSKKQQQPQNIAFGRSRGATGNMGYHQFYLLRLFRIEALTIIIYTCLY